MNIILLLAQYIYINDNLYTQKDPTTQKPTSKSTTVPATTKATTKGPTLSPTTSRATTVNPEDPCDGKNCHHGDCVVNNDDEAECKCDAGWHGDDCNTQDDPTTTTLAPTTIQPRNFNH